LTPVFQENSCLYLFRRDVFLARGNRLGRRPRLFVVDQPEAWDVDQESDVDVVEAVLQKRAGA
jgi:CMP-N-acetylneuraminic acid synthetase